MKLSVAKPTDSLTRHLERPWSLVPQSWWPRRCLQSVPLVSGPAGLTVKGSRFADQDVGAELRRSQILFTGGGSRPRSRGQGKSERGEGNSISGMVREETASRSIENLLVCQREKHAPPSQVGHGGPSSISPRGSHKCGIIGSQHHSGYSIPNSAFRIEVAFRVPGRVECRTF
jgi:hypothetical protein